MLAAIGSGFRRLADFSGRDAPRRFWPYALLVIGLTFAASAVAMNLALAEMFSSAAEYPDFGRISLGLGAAVAAAVALLAAAVTRRLHDTGRPGFWALPAPVFLATGLVAFPYVSNRLLTDESAWPLFFALFANNVLYLISLLGLAILLLMRSGPANRFGPPPGP